MMSDPEKRIMRLQGGKITDPQIALTRVSMLIPVSVAHCAVEPVAALDSHTTAKWQPTRLLRH